MGGDDDPNIDAIDVGDGAATDELRSRRPTRGRSARGGPARGRRAEPPPEDGEALGPPGDPEEAARTICLRQLDRRARTRAELAGLLRRRGIPDDAAATVLDRLAEVGLIDDTALAEGFAAAVHRERGLSGKAVALKLRQRGVDDESVHQAVAHIDRASERATAQRLVTRKLRSMSGLEQHVAARRLVGLLARKGYSAGLAHEVVRAALAERAGGPEWDAGEALDD